jgi:hypothetical protein
MSPRVSSCSKESRFLTNSAHLVLLSMSSITGHSTPVNTLRSLPPRFNKLRSSTNSCRSSGIENETRQKGQCRFLTFLNSCTHALHMACPHHLIATSFFLRGSPSQISQYNLSFSWASLDLITFDLLLLLCCCCGSLSMYPWIDAIFCVFVSEASFSRIPACSREMTALYMWM